jgi:hypothetical protein
VAPGYIEYPLWVAPHKRPLAGSKYGIKPWNRTSEMMHWELGHSSHFLAHFLADVLAHFLADVLPHFLAHLLAHLLSLYLPANARHTYRSAALYHQILHNIDVDSYLNTRQV